jgi:hypothetical protein
MGFNSAFKGLVKEQRPVRRAFVCICFTCQYEVEIRTPAWRQLNYFVASGKIIRLSVRKIKLH